MSWDRVIVWALSALVGGFIGGWITAFRIGRWRGEVEGKLKNHEGHLGRIDQRLEKGNKHVDQVPILKTKIEVVIDEIREVKDMVRRGLERTVTREECNRRHGDGT